MNSTHTTSLLIATALLHACSNTQSSMTEPEVDAAPDAAIAGQTDAPTYDELFSEYFAKGKPGHCATAGCHADPGHNVWLCSDKDTCYQGMLDIGLIDAADPTHSEIGDRAHSPLTWINPVGGNMPLDAQGENAEGRAAIEAWVAAGARND
jgi:hypothetical protein